MQTQVSCTFLIVKTDARNREDKKRKSRIKVCHRGRRDVQKILAFIISTAKLMVI